MILDARKHLELHKIRSDLVATKLSERCGIFGLFNNSRATIAIQRPTTNKADPFSPPVRFILPCNFDDVGCRSKVANIHLQSQKTDCRLYQILLFDMAVRLA